MLIRYYRQSGSKGQDIRFEAVLSPEEQQRKWHECVDMVMNNTRWVLDNLDHLPEFKVGWEDYHSKGYKRRKVYKQIHTEVVS